MRLLLVQTYLGRKEKPVFPLGLAYLAAACEDHEVQVLDQNVEEDPWGSLQERIGSVQPEVIGFSLRNIDTTQFRDPYLYYPALVRAVGVARSCSPEVPIVIGGPGFSMFPEQVMRLVPDVAYGVYLEGEETLPKLLLRLCDPASVPGVYYRRDGNIVFSGPAKAPDFARFSPRRDLFSLERYRDQLDAVGIEAKRGCPLRCLYCSYPHLNGARPRVRAPEAVVEELKDLQDRYGVSSVMFVDPVFNLPANHAEAICREILRKRLSVTWSAWFLEAGLTEKFVTLAIEAGCRCFSFSPDALSDSALKVLGKGLTKDDVYRVRDMARRIPEMRISCNFFLNPPNQTLGGFLRTVGFAIRTKMLLKSRVDGILMGAARIEPHTALHRLAVKQGYLSETDDLWARTPQELMRYFYGNPATRYLDPLLHVYVGLWRARSWLTQHHQRKEGDR
jgi:radical SAM superfamily enzyme YgiQ (UPF0313 family)